MKVIISAILVFGLASTSQAVSTKKIKKAKRMIASVEGNQKEYIMSLSTQARLDHDSRGNSITVLDNCESSANVATCIENRLKSVSPSITDLHFIAASSGYLTIKVSSSDPQFISHSYNNKSRTESDGISAGTIALDKPNCFCGEMRMTWGAYSVPGSDQAACVNNPDDPYTITIDPLGNDTLPKTNMSEQVKSSFTDSLSGGSHCYLANADLLQGVTPASDQKPFLAAKDLLGVYSDAASCLAAKHQR